MEGEKSENKQIKSKGQRCGDRTSGEGERREKEMMEMRQ